MGVPRDRGGMNKQAAHGGEVDRVVRVAEERGMVPHLPDHGICIQPVVREQPGQAEQGCHAQDTFRY
jgi:hypothetical protein